MAGAVRAYHLYQSYAMLHAADNASTSASSSACNGTFVTLVANERYAAPAICLHRQLRIVHTACPVTLVYNDRVQLPLAQLASTYGASNLVPLSVLIKRYRDFARPPSSTPATTGRRLFDGHHEVSNTHLKLWLWALPVARAVFVDIDVLVLRNVDSLVETELPAAPARGGIPGIGAVTCKSKYGSRYFNSGLLVFAPSLQALRALLEVERFATHPWYGHIPHAGERWPDVCSPRDDVNAYERLFPNASHPLSECRNKYGPGRQPSKLSKACESKYTDQSVFNQVYRQHTTLPGSFNDANGFRLQTAHIVHFVGEPKPWDPAALRGRGADPARSNATRLWRRRCAHVMANVLAAKNATLKWPTTESL